MAHAIIVAAQTALLRTPCASIADTAPKLRVIAGGMAGTDTEREAALTDVIAFLSNEISADPTALQTTLPAMLAVRIAFNAGWNAAGDKSQEEDDEARTHLKSYDEHIVRAPIVSAPDARAKLQLLLSHEREGLDHPEMWTDVVQQVELWLSTLQAPSVMAPYTQPQPPYSVRRVWEIMVSELERKTLADDDSGGALDDMIKAEGSLLILPPPDLFALYYKAKLAIDWNAKEGEPANETLARMFSGGDFSDVWTASMILDVLALCQQANNCPPQIKAERFPEAAVQRLALAGISPWEVGDLQIGWVCNRATERFHAPFDAMVAGVGPMAVAPAADAEAL